MRKYMFVIYLLAALLLPGLAFAQDVPAEGMGGFLGKIEEYAQLIFAVVGVFAAIATMTKNESDNKIVAMLYKVINTLGLNVGRATNG